MCSGWQHFEKLPGLLLARSLELQARNAVMAVERPEDLIAASACDVTIRDMSCSAHATQQILPPPLLQLFVRPAH